MKKQHSRLYYGCLTLTLLIFAQLTLPAFAEADTPDQPAITETDQTDSPPPGPQDAPVTDPDNQDPGNTPEPEPADTDPGNTPEPEPSRQDASDNTPGFDPVLENAESPPDLGPETENPVGDNPEPDPGPEPAQPPAEQNLPPGDPEELPAPSPSEDLISAQVAAAGDLPQPAPGNSYQAMVLPEDGSAVKAGEATELTATFTELSTTPLASAFLYIPDSLSIVDYSAVDVSDDWDYRWIAPGEEDVGFSDILSLWATIGSAILNKDKSVSATFTVTTTADQEHHFATSAWQDRATNEAGEGVGPGTTVNNRSTSYSEPGINVAVTSADDLDQIRDNPHWHYLQQNDIDLSSFGSGSDPDLGWQPIGSLAQPFIGSYNGGGHTIDNLAINRPEQDYVGLFGFTEATTTLTGINLSNVNISGGGSVGGLVGYNIKGQISGAFVSGVINAQKSYAGGLVGANQGGLIINGQSQVNVTGTSQVGGITNNNNMNSQVINSHATGTISGNKEVGGLAGRNYGLIERTSFRGTVNAASTTETRAGGLVGYNYGSGASICCSFAEATVTAPGGINVGGLVGFNSGSKISYSYATGAVIGTDHVGGLVGENFSTGQIINSYSHGTVSGNKRVGGLVGLNTAGINSCYSTANVSGSTEVGGLVGLSGGENPSVLNSFYANNQPRNAFGSAVSDEALKTEATFSGAGWNIAALSNLDLSDPPVFHWYIEAGESYPTLWWQHLPAPAPVPDPDPDPDPDPSPNPDPSDGGDNNNNVNPSYYASLTIAPLNRQPALGSTAQLVLANSNNPTEEPLIGPGFVLTGSWSDLLQAEAAYKKAYANYIHLTEANPGTAQILLQLDLTLSRAAILALNQRLSADLTLLPAAQQAYHQALQLLNQHNHLLTHSQKLQAETILAEILSVLQLANHQ